MRAIAILAVAPVLALLPAASVQDEVATTSPVRQDYQDAIELDGRFVPADSAEIAIWPKAYGGELLFLEVVPHGTYVNAGDVIARFDTAPIDEQIARTSRDLATTELQHESTVVRAEMAEQSAQVQLEDAVRTLERAQKSLEGWEKFELPFHHRSNELSRQQYQHRIDDQVDELNQLEAMYRDDELVDAVEDIVLKRSRRDLASSRAGQELSLDRMAYDDEFNVVQTGKDRLRSVETQKNALDRLVRSQELDRKSRQDGVARSEVGLTEKREKLADLQADRERLIVRAPRAGVVLHGGAESYLPGQQRPVHERGSRGSFRTPLFCISNPDRLDVALAVGESQLAKVRDGMAAEVKSLVTGDAKKLGALSIERYPTASSAHAAEGSYAGRIAVEDNLHGVVAGMRAKVRLVCETLSDVLMLPASAVFHADEGAYCWTATAGGGESVKVPLSLGPESGGSVVVYGELDEHSKVLLEEPKK